MDRSIPNNFLFGLNNLSGIGILCGLAAVVPIFSLNVNFPMHLQVFYLLMAPTIVIVPICSLTTGTWYFVTGTTTGPFFETFREISVACVIALQIGIFELCVDRIFATRYLASYERISVKQFGFLFAILTYLGAGVCWIALKIGIADMNILNGVILILRTLTFIIVIVLYKRNKKLNHILAYQSTLTQRYQIIENIKILRVLKPYIIVNCFVGPIGPIISLFRYYTPTAHPYAMYHSTVVLSIFIAVIIGFCRCRGRRRVNRIESKKVAPSGAYVVHSDDIEEVRNVMGLGVPGRVTSTKHFAELRNAWA
uniref:7TM_GPCR_Srx domain-containing protein n=1 Tax=Panagrellus redivivus TaxID=6233 RepID=A0A7E4VI57_PANRE